MTAVITTVITVASRSTRAAEQSREEAHQHGTPKTG